MPYDDFDIELLRKWVRSLVSALDTQVDRKTQSQLLTDCGKACAVHYDALERAAALAERTDDLDAVLTRLNTEIPWCGSWQRTKGEITSVCDQCGCPLVGAGLVELSPAFCECSRGFVAALFETVLHRPVAVHLEQAIGRGDPVCRFVIPL